MNLSIQHVEVRVSSIEVAKEFYVNKLGLEILEEVEPINLLALKAGAVRVSVFGGFEPDIARDAKKAATHFVFKTDDIDQTFRRLSDKGLLFENGILEAPGFVRYISTTDPDGNTIEIAQYLRDPLATRI